jgi:maltodextrin utilization protein YvdJ
MLIKKRLLYATVIVMMFATTIYSQKQQQMDEGQQIYMQYSLLNQQLQELQQQALSDDKIAEQGQALNDKINSIVISNHPDAEQLMSQRNQIIEDFQKAQETENQEKQMELQGQYQKVNQKIELYQNEVVQQPEIQAEVMNFEQVVMNKMEELNPNVEEMINRLQDLRTKLEALQN